MNDSTKLKDIVTEIKKNDIQLRLAHLENSVERIDQICKKDFGVPILTESEKEIERKRIYKEIAQRSDSHSILSQIKSIININESL
jgi:hypothetical protein